MIKCFPKVAIFCYCLDSGMFFVHARSFCWFLTALLKKSVRFLQRLVFSPDHRFTLTRVDIHSYGGLVGRTKGFQSNRSMVRAPVKAVYIYMHANQLCPVSILSHAGGTDLGRPRRVNWRLITIRLMLSQNTSSFGGLCLNWSLAALQLWEFYLPESLTDANLYELNLEANPYQPDQNSMLLQSGGFGTLPAETPVTSSPVEVQQSLVNASVSQVNFQDEVSVCLKRAIEFGVSSLNYSSIHLINYLLFW